jgi:hypothetical protein
VEANITKVFSAGRMGKVKERERKSETGNPQGKLKII